MAVLVRLVKYPTNTVADDSLSFLYMVGLYIEKINVFVFVENHVFL